MILILLIIFIIIIIILLITVSIKKNSNKKKDKDKDKDIFYNNLYNQKNQFKTYDKTRLKFLNLILYSETDINYIKMKKYLSEYLKTLNIQYYFYCYNPKLKKEYEIIDDVIYLKGIESMHPGCLYKTLKVFTIFENNDYDFIIRSNISTIVNFDILEKQIFENYIIYGCSKILNLNWIDKEGGIVDKKYHGTLYPTGVCIILCKNLVKLIVKNQELIKSYNVIDDLSIGIFLKNYELKIVKVATNAENSIQNTCVYRNKREGNRKLDVQIMKNILHEIIINKSKPKTKPKTFNCLIATIGRKTLQNMLNSLSGQLSKDDCLTIVFDGHKSIPYFDISKFKCKVNQYYEPVALKFSGHGIRNKYASLLEKRDYILHADDDDIYENNAFNYLRKNCIDDKTLYIALMKQPNTNNIHGKKIKKNFIGTPCGIIPYVYNNKSRWGYYYGGDGSFYETLEKKYEDNIIFLNKIIYLYLK